MPSDAGRSRDISPTRKGVIQTMQLLHWKKLSRTKASQEKSALIMHATAISGVAGVTHQQCQRTRRYHYESPQRSAPAESDRLYTAKHKPRPGVGALVLVFISVRRIISQADKASIAARARQHRPHRRRRLGTIDSVAAADRGRSRSPLHP